MKMCRWFRIFDGTVFDRVIAHAKIQFVGQTFVSSTPTSFIGNFVEFLLMIQRCACGFRILIWRFLLELLTMLTYSLSLPFLQCS